MGTPLTVEFTVLDKLSAHVKQMNDTMAGFARNAEHSIGSLTKGFGALGGIAAGATVINFLKDIRQEAKEVEIESREVKTKAPKLEGIHFRTYWKFVIVNAEKLPREFLKPDEVAINSHISKLKENAKIPGVRIYSEEKPIG